MWWSVGEWIIITIGPTAACGIGPRQALLSSVVKRAVSGPKHQCIMEYKSVEFFHEHWTNKKGQINTLAQGTARILGCFWPTKRTALMEEL
jgi:hypothetical protein